VCTAIGLVLFVLAAGCGGKGTKTYPVRGKVVVKNGQLGKLVGGYVRLESVPDPKYKALGEIEEDGQFVLASFVDDKKSVEGVPEGEYQVRVEPAGGEDKPLNDDDPIIVRKGGVLLKYRDFKTSGLKYKVEPRENTMTVEVEVKK
jgi:hypothetical protein